MARAMSASLSNLPPASPRPPEARLPEQSFLAAAQAYSSADAGSSALRRSPSAQFRASSPQLGRYVDMRNTARSVSPTWPAFGREVETMTGPSRGELTAFRESAARHGSAAASQRYNGASRSSVSAQEDVFDDYDYALLDGDGPQWDESTTDDGGADAESIGSLTFGDSNAEMEFLMLRDEARRRARRQMATERAIRPSETAAQPQSPDLAALEAETAELRSADAALHRLRAETVHALLPAPLQGAIEADFGTVAERIQREAALSGISPTQRVLDRYTGAARRSVIDPEQMLLDEEGERLRAENALLRHHRNELNSSAVEIAVVNELCGALAPQPSYIDRPIESAATLVASVRTRPAALQSLNNSLSIAAGMLHNPELRRAHNVLMAAEDLREGVAVRLEGMHRRLLEGEQEWLQPDTASAAWTVPSSAQSADTAKPEECLRALSNASSASMEVEEVHLQASASTRSPIKLGPLLHLGQAADNILPCSFLRSGVVFNGRQAYSKALADKGRPARRKRRTSEPHTAAPVPSTAVDLVPLSRRGRRMASMGSPAVPAADTSRTTSTRTITPMRSLGQGYEELECIITEDAARIMRSRAADSWAVRVSFHSVDLEKGLVNGVMHALEVRKLCSVDPVTTIPKVTTVFDGEIVDGRNFGIWTNKWGCEQHDDVHQWQSLRAFEGLSAEAVEQGRAREGYILMRWKERAFINTDAKSSGLTISGFYHVAIHRYSGSVEALYWDRDSSPFQRMTLSPSPSFGAFSIA